MSRHYLKKLFVAVAMMVLAPQVLGGARSEIRFYKLNRQDQQVSLFLVPGAGKEGCHAFPVKRAIHRVAVVNFSYCQLYSTRACEDGTEIPARWKNRVKEEKVRLTPGSRWILKADGHVDVRAWRCTN